MAISHVYLHLVVNIGNFTLLLTCSGQEWQFHMSTYISHSGQHWQFHILTDITDMTVVKNGNFTFTLLLTSSGLARMAISHCCCHLVVTNGTFLLTSSGHQAISHFYLHLVVNIGNFTL